jgi:hypothetical protein
MKKLAFLDKLADFRSSSFKMLQHSTKPQKTKQHASKWLSSSASKAASRKLFNRGANAPPLPNNGSSVRNCCKAQNMSTPHISFC